MKFETGDKVRVCCEGYHPFKVGEIGEILGLYSVTFGAETLYRVRIRVFDWNIDEDYLEKAPPKKILEEELAAEDARNKRARAEHLEYMHRQEVAKRRAKLIKLVKKMDADELNIAEHAILFRRLAIMGSVKIREPITSQEKEHLSSPVRRPSS